MIPSILAIHPQITESQRVLYTFSNEDIIEQTTEWTRYRFPHCPCTYWTHVRSIQESQPPVEIEIVAITEERTAYTIVQHSGPIRWHDTRWPLPSIQPVEDTGYYLKVRHVNIQPLSITLMGWIDLFPIAPVYVLHNETHIGQFTVIQENTEPYEKNVRTRGTLHDLTAEQPQYREWERNVANRPTVVIRPLSQY